ncbi:hypothetical protein [Lactobacillus delbrueckii]|uniref:hypothetical protein n=1 Tax=Lactobacillus delbrueckii TaxID=1584 RepID=UPI0022838A68|nr:hypothetical protein [Lactobacillus delbrueckii]
MEKKQEKTEKQKKQKKQKNKMAKKQKGLLALAVTLAALLLPLVCILAITIMLTRRTSSRQPPRRFGNIYLLMTSNELNNKKKYDSTEKAGHLA